MTTENKIKDVPPLNQMEMDKYLETTKEIEEKKEPNYLPSRITVFVAAIVLSSFVMHHWNPVEKIVNQVKTEESFLSDAPEQSMIVLTQHNGETINTSVFDKMWWSKNEKTDSTVFASDNKRFVVSSWSETGENIFSASLIQKDFVKNNIPPEVFIAETYLNGELKNITFELAEDMGEQDVEFKVEYLNGENNKTEINLSEFNKLSLDEKKVFIDKSEKITFVHKQNLYVTAHKEFFYPKQVYQFVNEKNTFLPVRWINIKTMKYEETQ